MEGISVAQATTKSFFSKIVSGSLLIAGTAIGAGMLGIPLLTAQSGFYPAILITVLVWLFMLATGLLIVEATLWMPPGSNILSMTARLLGAKSKFAAGGLFLFLYYCLMIAYIAGGAPLFAALIQGLTGVTLTGVSSYLVFTAAFGLIVFRGIRSIDRINLILVLGLVVTYIGLVGFGAGEVNVDRFDFSNLPAACVAAPVLFSAFGYHNIIPSMSTYLERDRKALRLSVFCGTALALVVYSVWQWLVIGAVPLDMIASAKAAGEPASAVLQNLVSTPWLGRCAAGFAFFALITSLLGVALSMTDFIADGMKKAKRVIPTVLTFVPPLIIAIINPTLFDKALGIAGGFGEAVLNGLLPVMLVWAGRYRLKLEGTQMLPGRRWALALLGACALVVVALELRALTI